MDVEERRALTAAGPKMHIVPREDLLKFIDAVRDAEAETARYAAENRALRIIAVLSMSLLLWLVFMLAIGWL